MKTLAKNITDYDLLQIYSNRENINECSLILYYKYMPLIRKYAKKVSYNGKNLEIKNDFIQDAYFETVKCIKSISITKIPLDIKNTWKFSSRFKFNLSNLLKLYYTNNLKDKTHIINLEDKNNELNFACYDHEDFVLRKISYNKCLNLINTSSNLSNTDKLIFNKKIKENYTFTELGKIFKVGSGSHSFHSIYKCVKYLKNLSIYNELKEYI